MSGIVAGATVPLRSGLVAKIVEVLAPNARPAWERQVGGRSVVTEADITMENAVRWGANLVLEVNGERTLAQWSDIDLSGLQAPAAVQEVKPTVTKPKLSAPVQTAAPVRLKPVLVVPKPSAALPVRQKLVLKLPSPKPLN